MRLYVYLLELLRRSTGPHLQALSPLFRLRRVIKRGGAELILDGTQASVSICSGGRAAGGI
jgi:hypothetical protein